MRRLLLAVTLALAGCPGGKPTGPTVPVDARVEIARLEAERGAGVDRLIARAGVGDPATRALALRALGRVGGPRALAALIAALEDPTPAVASRAAAAIGVLAATTDPPPAVIARTSSALLAALARPGVDAAEVIEALGRAGDASALAPLTSRSASTDPAIAESAAIALGRYGRRQLALDAPARAALIDATGAAHDTAVRRAAVWALGREHRGEATPPPAPGRSPPPAPPVPPDPAVTSALIAAVADSDGETRAAAIAALVRRKSVADGATVIEQALRDLDWRVAVEAVRALAGETGTDVGRDVVATSVVRAWTLLAGGTAPSRAHIVLEGLRAIAPAAARPAVRDAVLAVQAGAAVPMQTVAPLVRGWVHCLATAALERAGAERFDGGTRMLDCGNSAFPAHLRAQLLGGLIEAGIGTPIQRRDALVVLFGTADPARRIAALEALPHAWAAFAAGDQQLLVPAVTRALAGDAVAEVGAAAETAGALLAKPDLIAAARGPLAVALVDRAGRAVAEPEPGAGDVGEDPELAGTLLGAIATAKLAAGRAACRRAVTAAAAVIRTAGRDCITALDGGTVPDPARAFDEPAAATPPDLDVTTVVGHRVTWTVKTSRGTIAIALAPDVAPWHVAAIVDLTRRKFYDGLVFHRVVPDFVVQGGDPTGTGWGGPGFTLPAEPGSRSDGTDYQAGAVGFADAGKDSGGSQWFVMHARAAHLEGRYTRVGKVTAGQEVVDALVIGDRVVSATVTID